MTWGVQIRIANSASRADENPTSCKSCCQEVCIRWVVHVGSNKRLVYPGLDAPPYAQDQSYTCEDLKSIRITISIYYRRRVCVCVCLCTHTLSISSIHASSSICTTLHSRQGGFRTPLVHLFVHHVFYTCFWPQFYAQTTDAEFDLQIAALSGPRACLGHLNHHAKSLTLW